MRFEPAADGRCGCGCHEAEPYEYRPFASVQTRLLLRPHLGFFPTTLVESTAEQGGQLYRLCVTCAEQWDRHESMTFVELMMEGVDDGWNGQARTSEGEGRAATSAR